MGYLQSSYSRYSRYYYSRYLYSRWFGALLGSFAIQSYKMSRLQAVLRAVKRSHGRQRRILLIEASLIYREMGLLDNERKCLYLARYSLTDLPLEILLLIITYLDLVSISRLSRSCKALANVWSGIDVPIVSFTYLKFVGMFPGFGESRPLRNAAE